MCSRSWKELDNEAGNRMEYAKALIDALIEIEEGRSDDESVEFTLRGGQVQRWREKRCRFCDSRLRLIEIEAPDGPPRDGVTAQFCAGCWYLDLFDRDGDCIASGSRQTRRGLLYGRAGGRPASVTVVGGDTSTDSPIVLKEDDE